jgi:hypothetical protein
MRVEYGFDPWINTPDHQNWRHAGHSISISLKSDSISNNTGLDKASGSGEFTVRAHKFGDVRPESGNKETGKVRKILSRPMNKEKLQDHNIANYVRALEQLTLFTSKSGTLWPTRFAGEEGTGVQGLNKEKRLVC